MARGESPDRGRDRDRDRRDRDQSRYKHDRNSRRRGRSRSYSRSPDRDHKRRRASPTQFDLEATARRKGLSAQDAKETRKQERENEQRALDEEIEKRRKRIEAWQEQRRKLQTNGSNNEDTPQAPSTAPSTAPSAAPSTDHGNTTSSIPNENIDKNLEEEEKLEEANREWNLDDEDHLSDDDLTSTMAHTDNIHTNTAATTDPPPKVNSDVSNQSHKLDEGRSIPPPPFMKRDVTHTNNNNNNNDDDDDPLDAFMKQNNGKLLLETNKATPRSMSSAPPHETDKATPVDEKKVVEEGDDEVDPLDAFMAAEILPQVGKQAHKSAVVASHDGDTGAMSRPNAAQPPFVPKEQQQVIALRKHRKQKKQRRARNRPSIPGYASDSSLSDYIDDDDENEDTHNNFDDDDDDDDAWAKKVQAGRLTKSDKLGAIDRASIKYAPFRRNFYIEVPELARMSRADVDAYRKQLDGIKARGKDIPKPLKNWNQAGLSARIMEVLKKAGFDAPLPIQAQAVPVIMSGRDCMGIAKTGSGKTLAFVLPMIRHIKDQSPIVQGDGPVALIMAPTRELVTQIGKEVKRFSRAAGISCTCIYGGSGVANQISELKRGTEAVVCTPGRMIDILTTGAGKITNLRRVTYLVMDEADRMFDMGFEPQIMRIVNNIRPDRQTVLFSATFPRSVETLARQVLQNPVEIQVGGRSVVNPDVTQYVEIRQQEERFLRLLELLGEWYERGKLLIFVSSQDKCDALFRDLLRAGYPCLSLHGGKDQSDRESTISDFKSNVCNVLVATSVAARGLDVKDLVLVVNYDCPNHHEDYVHRVGRTGRAGNKGTAVTFISPEEDQYASDLVKALKESGAPIPSDLAALAEGFEKKRKAGLVKTHGSGFGGSGFKFDEAEDQKMRAMKKQTAKEFGIVEESESEDEHAEDAENGAGIRMVGMGRHEEEDGVIEVHGSGGAPAPATGTAPIPAAAAAPAAPSAVAANTAPKRALPHAEPPPIDISSLSADAQARIKAAQAVAEKLLAAPSAKSHPGMAMGPAAAIASNPVLAAAQAAAQRLSMQLGGAAGATGAGAQPGGSGGVGETTTAPGAEAPEQVKYFQAELEINDFPQQARWKVTHRQTIQDIGERLSTFILVKGRYMKPGTMVPEGERKLYLQIEGTSVDAVRKAKAELKRLVEESTEKAMRREAPTSGRYSLM